MSRYVDAAPFAEVVRVLHEEGGISLLELARFAGVGRTTVHELYRGTKPRLMRSTAEDLKERLLMLLPEGAA